ncbi:MAG: hypothetical protein U0T11_08400 [Chitinophagaceae bacterium]
MNENRIKESKAPMNVRAVFDLIMGLVYLVVGGILVFAKYIGFTFSFPPQDVAVIFGAFSMVYGAFRIYRGIQTLRSGS